MPSVANTVVVHNRTKRAYFIGDVEVPAGGWGRVNPDHPFLADLVSRGDFRTYEDKAPEPVVTVDAEPEAPAPAPSKKAATKTPKGDE